MLRIKKQKGVSLTEILIVIVMLGVLITLMKNGSTALVGIFQTSGRMEGQRKAQEVLYQIADDVRGARSIISISSTCLSLRVFDQTRSYDINVSSAIFDPVTFGTATYRYVAGNPSYLSYEVTYATRSYSTKYLENILEPDDPSTAATEFIFEEYPPTIIPYLGAHIVFRCAQGSFKKQVKTFEARAEVRSKIF